MCVPHAIRVTIQIYCCAVVILRSIELVCQGERRDFFRFIENHLGVNCYVKVGSNAQTDTNVDHYGHTKTQSVIEQTMETHFIWRKIVFGP